MGKYIDNKIKGIKGNRQDPIRKVEASGDIALAYFPRLAKSPESIIQHLSNLLHNGDIIEFNKIRESDNYNNLMLGKVDLPYANLMNVNLRGINLDSSNLRYADLSGAILYETNLADADLSYATFIGTYIYNTNLRKAKLMYAKLTGVDIYNVNFDQADLGYAKLVGVDFNEMNTFTGANLNYAKILGAHFNGTISFIGATLHYAEILGAHFNGMVNFIGYDLAFTKLSRIKEPTAMLNLIYSRNISYLKYTIFDRPALDEYSESLKNFVKAVNNKVESLMISPAEVSQLQERANALANEVNHLRQNEISDIDKKRISTHLMLVIDKTLQLLPETTDTMTIFRLLSPFNKLMTESIEDIVHAIKNKRTTNN